MEFNEGIFAERKRNNKFNTSYPLNPSDWAKYRIHDDLLFELEEELSFYIHIPFCKKLCSFCEYTRILCPNEEIQKQYLQTLKADIQSFIKKYPNVILRGFDIGGGTPTALSDVNFSFLMDIFHDCISTLHTTIDFEPSIEGTFQTLSKKKMILMNKVGIKRLSLGIQSTKAEVLKNNLRESTTLTLMYNCMKLTKLFGIQKINLDLMYGLKGQKQNDIETDLIVLSKLMPEQVTLYELRTNMLKIDNYMSNEQLFNSYCVLYNGLKSLGYHARFGQNTFSLNSDDFGVSSYLRSRMLDGVPYKGFGISAQSMSRKGISYNKGKNNIDLTHYFSLNTFEEEYVYHLPKQELLAKYIAISGYSGRFSLKIASSILEKDFYQNYNAEINFCLELKLITLENNNLFISYEGFKNYGSVFSLFYNRE